MIHVINEEVYFLKSFDKKFEVEAIELMLFLLKRTNFTLDELVDAKTYDMSVNRHVLTIGNHIENIDKEICEEIKKWLSKNKYPNLFSTFDGKGLRYKLEDGCIEETDKQKLFITLPKFTGRNVTIKEIAQASGKDAQYLRYGLQMGFMDFGYAYQKEGSSEFNYYCPDKKVWEKLGYYSEDKY